MARIRGTGKGQTYLSCEIAGLDTNYSYNDRYVKWYFSGEYKGRRSIYAHESSGGEITATGLTPKTRYYIEAEIYNRDGLLVSLTAPYTTEAPPPVPKFYWTYSGAKQGVPVNGSRKISGMEFYVSAREWNELADNVRKKMENCGMDTSLYRFDRIYVAVGDVFTAVRFNYMRAAIGALSATGLGSKTKGDNIIAEELNLLMDCINRVT